MTAERAEPDPIEPPRSVLEFLEAKVGGRARVALRQDDSVPMVKPLEGLTQAGKYQIQGEIARGGVGVVLRGHDTELGRDVALKMIGTDHRDNPEVIQRFVEEAQIGGQLQHPGIVPVYDLGLHEGRPFFTMKLIKGRTLAALLEEHGESRSRLLAIFEAVCQTVAYAHTRGVIHRDLKPANVMVGAFGEVQVVDWGMGKVLKSGGVEDERCARSAQHTIVATVRSRSEPGSVGSQSVVGSVMGTPAYMPPEQAMGDVDQMDERSDVFCLGAILAEILTGLPPYPGSEFEVIRRAARAELEPCRARIAACDADDDLKVIANRCLIAALEARPRNAGEVQVEISRYLTGLEDKARIAHVAAAEERIRVVEAKRKQKLTLALASSVLLTLILGGGGLWYVQGQKAAREAQLQEQFQTAVLAAGRAEDAAAALAGAARARDLLAQAEATLPVSLVADLDRIETRARATQAHGRLQEGNAKLLEALDALRGPGSEDERFVIDWQATDRRYATTFAEHELRPDDGTVEEAAAGLAKRGVNQRLASALDEWASVRRELAAPAGARRLADVASRLDGDATRATLRDAILAGDVARLTKLASEADVRALDPRTLYLLGESLRHLAEPGLAYAFCRRAYEAHAGDFFLAHSLARSMYEAWRAGADVTAADALRYYLVARALRPDDYIASVELAQQFINAGERESAELFLRELIAERPTDAVLHGELGVVLASQGRTGEGEAEYQKAIQLDGKQAWCRQVYADFLANAGRGDEAFEQAHVAVALAPQSAPMQTVLGRALTALGRPAEALAAYERAVELAPRNPFAQPALVSALRANGRRDEALAACRKVLADAPEAANVHGFMAQELISLGRSEEALTVARAALARAELARRPDAALVSNLNGTIARAQDAVGSTAAADESYRRAMAADPTNVNCRIEFASRLQILGRLDEALPVFERVLVLEPSCFAAHIRLGSTYFQRGRMKDAALHWRRAIEIDPKHAMSRGALAEALLALGQLEEGLTWARSAVKLAPESAAANKVFAVLLSATGKDAEALAALKTLARPLPVDLLVLYGSLEGRLGLTEEALADLREATKRAPEDYGASNALVQVLFSANRTEDAVREARRGVELAPKIPGSHFTLGAVLHQLRRWEEAETSFKRGLAIASDPRARLMLAGIPALRGDPEESARRLRALVAGDPDDADACTSLARLLATAPLEHRSEEEALRLARRALKLKPDASRLALASTLFRAGQHAEAEREFAQIFEKADDGHACLAFLRAMNLLALENAPEARHWVQEARRRMAAEGEHPEADHRWLNDEAAKAFEEKK